MINLINLKFIRIQPTDPNGITNTIPALAISYIGVRYGRIYMQYEAFQIWKRYLMYLYNLNFPTFFFSNYSSFF